ncbi:peptidyl-prolyl cis-trans isomerase CYP37, chloroplastic [Physcomitrium patens]|uniref:PPIase cyclophilin-type domain-containing protein n=1 Tax=Physcomitrium patens TaxID=3218 RepID=A0A2K1KV90_PHYPA|nr:peptidyl-prolyl cis-trans isomerase CYP37, chloroplastic-like [Physcomitrium patens]PNR57715.1 hypothetical protein PHYPA_004709 [Physcomitrium patens]|eukprot:XP_024370689.1 peptidyl-prolyl cis-trans isomerase CYP37, chloroplastic-like [Physcomitrella patens]
MASAACIASKVIPVSQISSLSNSIHSKLNPNSSKTRCIDPRRGSCLEVRSLSNGARDVDFPVKIGAFLRATGFATADGPSNPKHRTSDAAADVNLWQKQGGRVFALLLATLQAVAPIPVDGLVDEWCISPAEAVLYSPDTKVPRSAEVALRRAIPAVNVSMKKMQESLEDIFYLLRIPQRKPYGSMDSDVKKALKLATDDKDAILAALPADQKEKGTQLYNDLMTAKSGFPGLLDAIEAKDADKVSIRLASSLDTIAQLEVMQATGLAFLLPKEYQGYPHLTGRAVAEFTLEKGDGSTFTVAAGGGPQPVGMLEVVLDGYSAPLTAGNVADMIQRGVYNGVKLRTTEQAILSDTADLSGAGRELPIEILPSGEFQPLYRTTLNVQDGELPVLPLSVYGAVAMAHNKTSEDFSSPSQFFFYLYDRRNSGLGGLSFEEGQFSVFGYVTKGRELLSQLKTGDVIKEAKLVSGTDRLVQ